MASFLPLDIISGYIARNCILPSAGNVRVKILKARKSLMSTNPSSIFSALPLSLPLYEIINCLIIYVRSNQDSLLFVSKVILIDKLCPWSSSKTELTLISPLVGNPKSSQYFFEVPQADILQVQLLDSIEFLITHLISLAQCFLMHCVHPAMEHDFFYSI